jgi:GWxTD domain-containing protein
VVSRNPSPFSVPVQPTAGPAIALATHARRTLLFDPFLPAPMPQVQAQPTPPQSGAPAATWRQWLNEDVAYIITSEERKVFLQLTTDAEREQFVERFWMVRDPTPATVENEFRDEHYRRIEYANKHFSSRVPGWKTDRGRVYISYGPPDEIDSHPQAESWRYRFIEGLGNNAVIEFADPAGTGDYRMTPGVLFPENLASNWPALAALATRSPSIDDSVFSDSASPAATNVLPIRVQIDYVRLTSDSTMSNITVQLENKDLQFEVQGGVQKSRVNVLGRITTMERRPVTTFEKPTEMQVPAELSQIMMQNRSLYQQAVPLPPGRYRMTIVAKDVLSGKLKNYQALLDVPQFDDDKLASSSLILADTIEKLPARKIGAMFAVGDTRIRPRPGNSFTTAEKLGIYLEVYNFVPDPITQRPSGTIEYEIDKAVSNEKVQGFSEDIAQMANGSASQVSIEKMLPLTALAPGSYTLKITVIDRNGNRSLQRQGNFTVAAQ